MYVCMYVGMYAWPSGTLPSDGHVAYTWGYVGMLHTPGQIVTRLPCGTLPSDALFSEVEGEHQN